MKKLKLNLDEIKVESFSTNIKSEKKGTVNGFGDTLYASCVPDQCTYETIDLETCFSACVTGCYACSPTVTCQNTKQPCD